MRKLIAAFLSLAVILASGTVVFADGIGSAEVPVIAKLDTETETLSSGERHMVVSWESTAPAFVLKRARSYTWSPEKLAYVADTQTADSQVVAPQNPVVETKITVVNKAAFGTAGFVMELEPNDQIEGIDVDTVNMNGFEIKFEDGDFVSIADDGIYGALEAVNEFLGNNGCSSVTGRGYDNACSSLNEYYGRVSELYASYMNEKGIETLEALVEELKNDYEVTTKEDLLKCYLDNEAVFANNETPVNDSITLNFTMYARYSDELIAGIKDWVNEFEADEFDEEGLWQQPLMYYVVKFIEENND